MGASSSQTALSDGKELQQGNADGNELENAAEGGFGGNCGRDLKSRDRNGEAVIKDGCSDQRRGEAGMDQGNGDGTIAPPRVARQHELTWRCASRCQVF